MNMSFWSFIIYSVFLFQPLDLFASDIPCENQSDMLLPEWDVQPEFHERLFRRPERQPLRGYSRPIHPSEELVRLRDQQLAELLYFADEYDLHAEGFRYVTNPAFYALYDARGELFAYTFANNIHKHCLPSAQQLCVVEKRVDGALFVLRCAYDTVAE